MKNITSLLIFTFLFSNLSFAADHTKKKKKNAEAQTTTAVPSKEIETEVSVHKTGPDFSASVGFGTIGSKFHTGVSGQVEIPYKLGQTPVKFGAQAGFYIGPSSPSTWVLPILFTGSYAIPTMNDLKPYIGLGVGFSIFHVGVSSANVGPITVSTASVSSTDFALMVKPGANFGDRHQWFAELPFGTVGSSFALLPSVGMHF